MTAYDDRLNAFGKRLHELERELAELRRDAATASVLLPTPEVAAATVVPPPPTVSPVVSDVLGAAVPPPVNRPAPPAPYVPAAPLPPPRDFPPPPKREPFDLSKLLGARTLAMTGGVVSLLGIVFLFVLAVQRGWIGPVARVSLGCVASGLAVAVGWWLHRRFGETFAATAAAGVGIAGFYATLLAAASRYDLIPDPLALVLAVLIAAVATATALAWSDQLLAGLGLVGAILVPIGLGFADLFSPDGVVVETDGLPATGVAFALLMLAAALAVAYLRRWIPLLLVAIGAAGLQVTILLDAAPTGDGVALVLAIVFWALVLGSGVAEALRREPETMLAGWLVIAASAFSGYGAALLFEDRALGIALLASALANGVLAAVFFRRFRDLASLLWGAALVLAAIGTAQLVSEATLTIAWAAEAAVLAWLAAQLREPRFRVAALGWFVLALVHALAFDAPVSALFLESAHPAAGVPSLLALCAAALVVAWAPVRFDREPGDGWAALPVNLMLHHRRRIRLVLLAGAALLALEAASLTLLELFPSWDWGHVAVTGLWGATAIGLVLAGQRVPGLTWAGATVALAVGYDLPWLSGATRWCALAVAAATALVTGLLFERELGWISGACAVAGAALAGAAGLGIAGHDLQWLLVLAVGAGYAGLGAAFLRVRRDQSTLLWSLGLLLGVFAALGMLEGGWLVVAIAGGAAATTLLARFEERLDAAALSLLGLGIFTTLATVTVPADLFASQRHPGSGVPAALAIGAAACLYASLRTLHRTAVIWSTAIVAMLAASLAILELFESFGGSVETSFQRGHTGVSALWGLVGLGLLYAGLVRRLPALQLAGFGLFGLALAKLFVYDLAFLSSVTRALSFLAVGAVLIAGGFFYQRLAAAPEEGRTASE